MVSKSLLGLSLLSTLFASILASNIALRADDTAAAHPYPVACDGIAFGVGNVTIASASSPSSYQQLQSGPSHDFTGLPLLDLSTDPSFPPLLFMTCNSSYMDYQSYVFNADETNVTFYGHVTQAGGVGELFEKNCLTRTLDGAIVFAACNHVDGPSQLAQYWKMVKNEQNPALPAPINFVGHPNNTDVHVQYTPDLYPVNGTKAVAENLSGAHGVPQYQLYFNVS